MSVVGFGRTMHFNLESHTIYYARHGSHAYGLNVETSDEDFKGICIPPLEFELGFLHNFEQVEEMVSKGHPADRTVYGLKKFMKLAAACNPNIIEVLFCEEGSIIHKTFCGDYLRKIRYSFLSKLAFNSFSGYALAQRKKCDARGMDDVRARKNAMHLLRLSRMCHELMKDGEVKVWRKDREELLAIRNGERSLESIFTEVDDLYGKAKYWMDNGSKLPDKPNYETLERECVTLHEMHYHLEEYDPTAMTSNGPGGCGSGW